AVDELAHQALALAAAVAVGGVDKVAAGVDIAVEDGSGVVLADTVADGGKRHRPQTQGGDAEAGTAQGVVGGQRYGVCSSIISAVACGRPMAVCKKTGGFGGVSRHQPGWPAPG